MVKYTRRLCAEQFRPPPAWLIRQHSNILVQREEAAQPLLVAALRQCCNMRELEYGKRIHDNMTQQGTEPDTFLSNILIDLYRKCQDMTLSRQVFETMKQRNIVTWNCLIMGYVENRQGTEALKLFSLMDCEPNHVTYLAALKACTSLSGERLAEALQKGMDIHRRIEEAGLAANTAISNTLIQMYSKCHEMSYAREAFHKTVDKSVVTWTCLIMGYVENGERSKALELFWSMDCEPDYVTCLAALKACAGLVTVEGKERALQTGMAVHRVVKRCKFDSNVFVSNTLVDMYSKCGEMTLAKEIFDRMIHKDVVTWNCLILGYVENGDFVSALELFARMDFQPNSVTCLGVLKACTTMAKGRDLVTSLKEAKAIHERIKELRLDSGTAIANTLLEMYCKFGKMELAEGIFRRIVDKNSVSWTCLMLGYVENGESWKGLDVFTRMDCHPDRVSCVAALRACIKISCSLETEAEKERLLERGVAVHRTIKDSGLTGDIVLENTLLEMYRRCGNMHLCKEQFDRMSSKNVVTWNCLMLGYIDSGEQARALETFGCMVHCEPNHITFLAAVKACTGMSLQSSERLEKGVVIHKKIKESAFSSSPVLASSLVDMYSKCGEMKKARDVFDSISSKDVALWNSLMSGYIENGESLLAMALFSCMDCEANHITYLAMMKACTGLATEKPSDREMNLKKGIMFHNKIKGGAIESNVMVSCSLIDMYSKYGDMKLAKEVFDKMQEKTLVAWNSLLLGYVENGESSTALELLTRIDCQPDHVTLVAALKACAHLAGEVGKEKALRDGLAIHRRVKELGYESNAFVASTLVDMYSKCEEIGLAREVFDGMIRKDVVTWNCLILGYVENDESWLALETFIQMDCEPTPVTYLAVLKACSRVAAMPFGRVIHGTVCRFGLEHDVVMSTALVDLYGSCGCMDAAVHVFDGMQSPGLASWNALLARYSSLGDVAHVFRTARKAQDAGVGLDSITFIHILTACSHAGLVEQGEMYFESMMRQGIKPAVDHYNCMVDMLGRANKLEEAISIVRQMPEANEVTWMTLLGACRKWNNLEVGKVAFDAIVAGERTHAAAAAYVVMADIYGSLGMWSRLHEISKRVDC